MRHHNSIFILLLLFFNSCSVDEQINKPFNRKESLCLSSDIEYIPGYPLNRFEDEIYNYEKNLANSIEKQQSKIIFFGSSTMRFWNPYLKSNFKNLPIIGHGFGGSTFPELIYYAPRLIFPYHPKLVVIYCENDQFVTPSKSTKQVKDDFCALISFIHKKLPTTKILYIAMKHSPNRDFNWENMNESNKLIKNLTKEFDFLHFIDLNSLLLNTNNQLDTSLFENDGVHLNEKAYKKWALTLTPILENLYDH